MVEEFREGVMDVSVTTGWCCSICHAVRVKPEKRLRSGWKRKSAKVYCETCWSKHYILRAIIVPVVSPLDQTWTELRTLLRQMWAATTRASNWMLTELYARDIQRGDEEKTGKARSCGAYHGDQIPRWAAEYRNQLNRWATDSNTENRRTVSFQHRREEAARRYRNRVESAFHQISATVAGYANRRHFASIEYHDSERRFCPEFPWYRLSELMREKCDAYEIGFEYARATRY
jgi:hypothetical protein